MPAVERLVFSPSALPSRGQERLCTVTSGDTQRGLTALPGNVMGGSCVQNQFIPERGHGDSLGSLCQVRMVSNPYH